MQIHRDFKVLKALKLKALQWSDAVKLMHRAKSVKKPVFYSGDHNGKSVGKYAQKYAKKIGGSTLNQDVKTTHVKSPHKDDHTYKPWWKESSLVKAIFSTGHAHAVLGGKVRTDSVWKKYEEPSLMKNDKVHTISQIHPDTHEETKKLKKPK
jgi:hypothetical protein